MVKKLRTFTVGGKFTMWCDISIEAENFEDALEKARELRETDFVDVRGGYVDGEYHGIAEIFDDSL